MANEQEASEQGSAQEPSPPEAAARQGQQPAPAHEPKVITIPTYAMAREREKERAKGRDQAMRELDKRAKALGFNSWQELEAAAAKRQQPQPAARAQQPAARQPASDPSVQRERQRLQARERELAKGRAQEERRRREAERKAERLEAEMVLRDAAVRAGVQDVDYAIELLRRKAKRGEIGEGEFNEVKFFRDDLRQTHPALYAVQDQPLTTAAHAATPAPAGANTRGEPSKAAQDGNGRRDAMKMTREEYEKVLRANGLQHPSLGS